MPTGEFSDKVLTKCLLIYEGRLGSARADSTYVLENAEVFSKIVDVELLVSKRHNWSVPAEISQRFKVVELGKPFNPKNIIQSILGQLRFGIAVRNFVKRSRFKNSKSFIIFHDWWPLQAFHFFSRRSNSILVLEVHNQIPLNMWLMTLFNHIDLFIATNSHKFNELRNRVKGKVILERNCVRPSRYLKQNLHIDPTLSSLISQIRAKFHYVIGYTGSFGPEKNPSLLFDLPQYFPDIAFVYVGKVSPNRKEGFRRISNLFMLEPIDIKSIPAFQLSCDILLVTLSAESEVSTKYTSTMKLLEYIAAQKPIVAPTLPSIMDMLSEEEFYGYEANSIESAKQVVGHLIGSLSQNKSIRKPLAERLEQYNWDKRNQRILKYCQGILDLENR
jgi:glycosyltransferase involved in cell wall biosynthesis